MHSYVASLLCLSSSMLLSASLNGQVAFKIKEVIDTDKTTDSTQKIKTYLSLILLNKSKMFGTTLDKLGVVLDEEGWINTDDLAFAVNLLHISKDVFTTEMLETLVLEDKSNSFCFNEDRTRIRFNPEKLIALGLKTKDAYDSCEYENEPELENSNAMSSLEDFPLLKNALAKINIEPSDKEDGFERE